MSASVGSHFGYKSSEGCVQQILDNHEPLIDRGGGTDGGTDGGSDDGGGWW